MRGAILCALSLMLGAFLVESWHDTPNYAYALEISWHQLVAIGIYNWLWVKEEQ